jgi:hypothetical protein
LAAQIHHHEAGGVPQLVGEVAGRFHRDGFIGFAIVFQADVLTGPRHFTDQGVAQGVGAVLIDQHQGIDAVPLGFGHLLVILIPHQAMDVDGLKGHGVGEMPRHHGHAGHPEKDDVEASDQGAGGVVGLEIFGGFVGPAHGRKGPQP